MPKSKFYAVAVGRTTGVFKTWDECKEQVYGYKGAKYKSFKTWQEAQAFAGGAAAPHPQPAAAASKPKAATASKYFDKGVGNRHTDVVRTSRMTDDSSNGQQIKRKRAPAQQSDASSSASTKRAKSQSSISNAAITARSNSISMNLMFDGGARGNPGIAGAGAFLTILLNNNSPIAIRKTIRIRDFVGHSATNNQAEYQGLIDGLMVTRDELQRLLLEQRQKEQPPKVQLIVQGDSNLVIQQCRGEFKVKSAKLKPLFQQAKRLLDEFATNTSIAKFKVVLEHVYRSDNKVADELANAAMDAQRSWMTTSDDGHETEQEFDSFADHAAKRV